MTEFPWLTFPIFELVCIVLNAIGAGYSLSGWMTARQDERENRAAGINGSIGMAARWRIQRERDRLVNQLIILVGRVYVLVYRYHHPALLFPLPIYVTGNASFLLLSWRLLLNSVNDRSERKAISTQVQTEHRRVLAGRRATDAAADASTARIEGILSATQEDVHSINTKLGGTGE